MSSSPPSDRRLSRTSRRVLRLFGIAAAVGLVFLASYPGAFASPYEPASETERYQHAIIPESSDAYEKMTGEREFETVDYAELSPTAQELIDRTKAGEPGHCDRIRYTPEICQDFVLVCDEYRADELPGEFTYGEDLRPEDAYVLVEDGDDRYILQTGAEGHADMFMRAGIIGRFFVLVTLIPLAAVVGGVAVGTEEDRLLAGTVGGGVAVAAVGVLLPYVEMFGPAPVSGLSVPFLGFVWLGMIGVVGNVLYRRWDQ